MLDIILSSVVPLFFVMALGYLAGWMRDIDNHHAAELNALVMDFALPASLFVAMVQTPRSLLVEQGTRMVVLAAPAPGTEPGTAAEDVTVYGGGIRCFREGRFVPLRMKQYRSCPGMPVRRCLRQRS